MRRFKAINSRTEEGAAWSLPLSNRERDMDAKTRDLALLAFLSVFCAGVAWILDYLILGSVFFALGVAALGIAWEGRDMDKDYLTLKRASASRLSGEWSEDDYDVLCEAQWSAA